MTTKKLSSRQSATLAVLQVFPPKFVQIHRMIEEMGSLKVDEAAQRRLARMLDEMKAAAGGVGVGAVADTLGTMAMIARRTGGLQTRVRGLREQFAGLKVNFEGAIKKASTPEEDVDEKELKNVAG